jgi:hypothetical protein
MPMPRSFFVTGQGHTALPGAAAVLLLLVAPAIGEAQWQFGSAPSFSSGSYGTDTRTEILHTPVTARRLFSDGDVTFVVPYTCIWGKAGVTIVSGSPVRTERLALSSSGSLRGDRVTGGSGATRATAETDRAVQSCGLGDVVVRGRYYVLDERTWAATVAVRGHVKAPTASAERGLGTGRPDEGIGIEVSRAFPRGTQALIDGGYTIIGKPDDVDYDNTWWYDVGFGQDLANDAINLSIFFEEYSAIIPGLVNARDIMTAVSVTGASGWRVQVSGQFGLTEGAPDHGVTFGASRRF